jgi:hypothetical protein
VKQDPQALPWSIAWTPVRVDPLQADAKELVLALQLGQALVECGDLGSQRPPD